MSEISSRPNRTVDDDDDDDYYNNEYRDSSKAQLAKGAYGEMKADLYFAEKLGYIPVKTGHP